MIVNKPKNRLEHVEIIVTSLALSILYTYLREQIPLSILSPLAHDDAFFLGAGKNLLDHKWFGTYSHMTLIKGETYSFFLALNGLMGFRITLTTSIIFSLSGVFFSFTLYRLHRRVWLFCLILTLILFNPALIPTRIIRDTIYAPETLILLSCAIQALFLARSARSRIGWGIATGASLATFWYTREEGVWILPALAAMALVQIWRDRRRWYVPFVGAATTAVILATIASLNYLNYGSFVLVEFTSKPFSSALNALQSVELGEPVSKVPVPKKVRQEIYKQSPAFAELEPFLEKDGIGRYAIGCQVYKNSCGDYAGGWFMWAFRDAVSWAGHYKSAAEANAYYRRLTAEVKAACDDGRLTCRHSLLPFFPRLSADDLAELPQKLQEIGKLLFSRGTYISEPSIGSDEDLRANEDFLGRPLRYPTAARTALFVNGWFVGSTDQWLEVRCNGQTAPIAIERRSSPDVADYFNDPNASDNRFQLQLTSLPQDCSLQVEGEESQTSRAPFDTLHPGLFRLGNSASQLYIDSIENRRGMEDWQFIVDAIREYRPIFETVILMLIAAMTTTIVLALVFDRVRFARNRDNLFLSLLFLIAVATRLAIVLLVDISSFPAITELYGGPIFPLFTTALCLPLVLLSRNPRAHNVARSRGAVADAPSAA